MHSLLSAPAYPSSHQPGLSAWTSLPHNHLTGSSRALSVYLRWGCSHLTHDWHKTMPCWVFCTGVVQKLKVWLTARQLQTFDRISSQKAFSQKAVTQSWIIPSACPKWYYILSKTQIFRYSQCTWQRVQIHQLSPPEPTLDHSAGKNISELTVQVLSIQGERVNYSDATFITIRSLVAINWKVCLPVYSWIYIYLKDYPSKYSMYTIARV